MKSRRRLTFILVAIAALVAMPGVITAEEPVTSFDQINTRLKIGDIVWVIETQGREVRGKIQAITADALTLDGARTLRGTDVRVIRYREHDSVKNGTLIGLGVGGTIGLAWCLAAAVDDSPRISTGVECAEGFIVFGGLGTFLGFAIDRAIPGKMRVAYGAPRRTERLRTAPLDRAHRHLTR